MPTHPQFDCAARGRLTFRGCHACPTSRLRRWRPALVAVPVDDLVADRRSVGRERCRVMEVECLPWVHDLEADRTRGADGEWEESCSLLLVLPAVAALGCRHRASMMHRLRTGVWRAACRDGTPVRLGRTRER